MKRSLNTRLLLLVLSASALVWVGTVLFSWLDTRQEIDELLDGHLAQAASLLIAQASHEIEEIDVEHAPLLHKDARKVAFQIWERGERLRIHSVNAPTAPLGGPEEGFSEGMVDGERWRVFTAWARGNEILIHVGERANVRAAIARGMVRTLLVPLLIALPVLGLLIWLAIRLGLRPLSALAAEVGARTPDNLTPIAARLLPREVSPLIERLNGLLARMEESLARERRFTAVAAHELRTPIAAIKAQAQVARSATASDARERALDNVILGTDRASRLVEQMLTLARVEGEPRDALVSCSPLETAREVVAEIAPAVIEQGIAIEVAGDEAAQVQAMPGLLRVLVRNLVDNAVRHAAGEGPVKVLVAHEAGEVHLIVIDNGPGIPGADRARVLERFHRLVDAGEGGSGLGLSIVQRIAQIHHARLELCDGPHGRGLLVRVRFPAAADTTPPIAG